MCFDVICLVAVFSDQDFYSFIFFLMSITKKDFKVQEKTFDRAGKKISFETGKLAVQADCSIRLQFGENVLLCATVMEANPRPDSDFLPLTIDVRESFSAAGRIG